MVNFGYKIALDGPWNHIYGQGGPAEMVEMTSRYGRGRIVKLPKVYETSKELIEGIEEAIKTQSKEYVL